MITDNCYDRYNNMILFMHSTISLAHILMLEDPSPIYSCFLCCSVIA